MKNQEQAKSENQIVANELEKHKKRSAKSVHDNRNEIRLKGACFIATKSDLDEIDATTAVCYALICKQTLFSLQDIPLSLPPVVTNLLQEYADVFPKEVPPGLPPIRGIEHQIDLFLGPPCPIVHHTGPTLKKLKKFSAKCKNCSTKVTCVSL
jgi:hypothetical protein